MPNIKLKNQTGTEITYDNVDVISIPLADGSGNFDFGLTDDELTMEGRNQLFLGWDWFLDKYKNRIKVKLTPFSQMQLFGSGYTKDLNGIKFIEKTPGGNCDIGTMFDTYYGKKLPVPIWEGTRPITSISGTFSGCQNLTDTEIKSFLSHFNFSKINEANYGGLFRECRSVRNINSILAQLHDKSKNFVNKYISLNSFCNQMFHQFCTKC